jgi:ribosomal protein L7Ae-like RNA K-turn-binding protein
MTEQKLFQMLGLAKRAGALITGNDAAMAAIRSGKARLVIVARDTGGNAMKKYHDKCRYYQVPLLELFDKQRLGQAVGKAHGAIIVVTDKGFAEKFSQLAGEMNGGEAH